MQFLYRWQSGTALMLAFLSAFTAAIPLSMAKSIAATPDRYLVAQRLPDSWRVAVVPAGTVIPTRYDKDKIVLTKEETVPITLTVSSDITSSRGTTMIPAGSQIKGNLKPAAGGTQFVAEEVTLYQDAQPVPLNATSQVITRTEAVSRRTNPNIFRGAAIGAGAAAILSEIFGRIDVWEVVGGAGLGALAEVLLRGRKDVEMVVVDPTTDLNLTLQSNFQTNSVR
ncbi:MAG TPA: hypothetical protein V6D10_12665 [Trichocoleus sp.]|jgi:hypothetical protein